MQVLSFLLLVLTVYCCTANAALSCTQKQSSTAVSNGTAVNTIGGKTFAVPEKTLFNNIWSTINRVADFSQTIFVCDDGRYGWSWNRVLTASPGNWTPNYPEVSYGWSALYAPGPSTTSKIPMQLKNITSLVATHNISMEVNDARGKEWWNLAYDIWITTVRPQTNLDVKPNITDEIMIWLHWNSQSVSGPFEVGVVRDAFGNVYNYSETSVNADTGVRYHQFRIVGGPKTPVNIDIKPFFDFVVRRWNRSSELWLTNIEFGSEVWDRTSGTVIINRLDYQVNVPLPTQAPTPRPTSSSSSSTSASPSSTSASSSSSPSSSTSSPSSTTSASSATPPPSSSTGAPSDNSAGSVSLSLLFVLCVLVVSLLL